MTDVDEPRPSHPWGVLFTILGTVLLDFDADACQSPARAYLLDVTIPEDHARGLSTFTIMAGLGGFMGYAMGGFNWDATWLGEVLGGHVKAVFSLITFIFVICVICTVTSFKEVPLDVIECDALSTETSPTLKEYLLSIIYMPYSLRILCLTNLFCWMAHVCYSLYFTDYVGEAVFGGDPMVIVQILYNLFIAPEGSEKNELYEEGVRFGCWGMSMYSLSCACYSLIIEKLIKKFKGKRVYVGGLLFYSSGMLLMALCKSKFAVIVFSWTAGVMYSTLFTMPYLLVANYHAANTTKTDGGNQQKRGLGTDVALVSSMVFLAQFTLSLCMGSIISYSGTTTAVVCVASFLSFCGSITATQVLYLDI
ncbi:hypothetical protein AAG570_010198 [Ranatra chinensis]|uniref:Uncharacterized protein n=1 Tax=Ranatra chinensis TaxID=642074 RepID=A0ABD0YLV4_9HEMI